MLLFMIYLLFDCDFNLTSQSMKNVHFFVYSPYLYILRVVRCQVQQVHGGDGMNCLYVYAHSAYYVHLQSSQGGGHRTLLYGHAILLRHNHSGMVRPQPDMA